MPFPRTSRRGFTLLELLVALAVVSVLSFLAAPYFSTLLDTHARQVFANELASGLRMARVEAITRNKTVIVQAQEEDWARGWSIIVDETGAGATDVRNPIIAIRSGSDRFQVIPSRNMTGQIAFNYLGVPRSPTQAALNGSIHLCARQDSGRHLRVVLARSGRVRVATTEPAPSLCSVS